MTDVSIRQLTKRQKEESLLNALMPAKSPSLPSEGELVEGVVITVEPSTIYVDIGRALAGVILGGEVKRYPRLFRSLNVGDTIAAKIVLMENEDGYTELSVTEAEEMKRWKRLTALKVEGTVLELPIADANKGGLIVEIDGIQGFMPVSQLSHEHYPRVEGGDKQKILQELKEFVGKTMKMSVIDVHPSDGKLIVSERAAEQEKLNKELARYSVGDTVEGTVTGVVDFGAFVKFDNLEGLVHISELDWQLIQNPHDVVAVGDAVKAQIIGIKGDRVSLSLKTLKENPWDRVGERYRTGEIVQGAVTKLNPFGAFVQLDKEIQGLAHVSEFGAYEEMEAAVSVGEQYPFEILSIEPKEYRLALGFRPDGKRRDPQANADNAPAEAGDEVSTKTAPQPVEESAAVSDAADDKPQPAALTDAPAET